jgi:hypothetical protein
MPDYYCSYYFYEDYFNLASPKLSNNLPSGLTNNSNPVLTNNSNPGLIPTPRLINNPPSGLIPTPVLTQKKIYNKKTIQEKQHFRKPPTHRNTRTKSYSKNRDSSIKNDTKIDNKETANECKDDLQRQKFFKDIQKQNNKKWIKSEKRNNKSNHK